MRIVLEEGDLIPQCARCGDLRARQHSCMRQCLNCGGVVFDYVPQGTPQPTYEEMVLKSGLFSQHHPLKGCNLPKIMKELTKHENPSRD